MGFAILSGAGLFKGASSEYVHVHTTAQAYASEGSINLSDALESDEEICDDAAIWVVPTDENGSLNGNPVQGNYAKTTTEGNKTVHTVTAAGVSGNCFVDFYVKKAASAVSELQIDAENFAGYYYVEASTLFRRQSDGVDMPAEITFPNVKIQSNFTFTLAATGDPSTFTFTMDAMPGYTHFNKTRKVLCAIQIVEDAIKAEAGATSVFPCNDKSHSTEEDATL